MTSHKELAKLKNRLDATFERASDVGEDKELQSDFAKYLCILVSGYIERAVVHIVLEHARNSNAPTLARFVERRTRRFANAKIGRIQELLSDFDSDWRKAFDELLLDEERDAVNSIVDQRNKVAHGGSVGLTYLRVKTYYKQAQRVIELVADVCEQRGV